VSFCHIAVYFCWNGGAACSGPGNTDFSMKFKVKIFWSTQRYAEWRLAATQHYAAECKVDTYSIRKYLQNQIWNCLRVVTSEPWGDWLNKITEGWKCCYFSRCWWGEKWCELLTLYPGHGNIGHCHHRHNQWASGKYKIQPISKQKV
jgi:hypothetical protein